VNKYLKNIWVKIGLVLVVFGWGLSGPSCWLATIGLWPDPNPNPIGPGLLFFFTFWPAVICFGVGLFQGKIIKGSFYGLGNIQNVLLPVLKPYLWFRRRKRILRAFRRHRKFSFSVHEPYDFIFSNSTASAM